MLILVTGATGKVGRNLIARLLEDPRFSGARVRALCHVANSRRRNGVAVVGEGVGSGQAPGD